MCELPSTRVQSSRPFHTTGVNYAGPISLRFGPPRNKTVTKVYIALFFRFVTKAVHFEVVTILTTEAFLPALRGFIPRRGKTRTIYSDNVTNFQGAANEPHVIYKMLQNVTDGNSTRLHGHWRMRMEIHSTTWNSLWRIMGSSSEIREVSSAKDTRFSGCQLRGTVQITCWARGLSELQTLCALSCDPFNPSYLSPGNSLIDEPLTQLPAADFTVVKCNRISKWQTYQQQLQQFWQPCSSDYLQSLQQRQHWQRTSRNLQPGDLVLLRQDKTAPLHWPTAVITNIHPGKDGIVRVVTIRRPKGVFDRSIINFAHYRVWIVSYSVIVSGVGSMLR